MKMKKKQFKPMIIYGKENTDIKIIKTLFKMKNACNKVVHFENEIVNDNLNINSYIFNHFGLNSQEGNDINHNQQENESEKNDNKIEDNRISINKVVEFIAYGNPSNKIIDDLKKYFDTFKEECNNLKEEKLSIII